MLKCNVYYWPDMGWEPVWHGLWINKAELKENVLKPFKFKGAILNEPWFLLQDDKNETEPVWLSRIFAIFQSPHVRLYA